MIINGLKSISSGTGRQEQYFFNIPWFVILLDCPLGHSDMVEGELQVKKGVIKWKQTYFYVTVLH